MALLWLWDRFRKRRVWAVGNVNTDLIDLDGCRLSRKDNVRRTLAEISVVRPDAIVIPPELAFCDSLIKTCEINHIPAIIVDNGDCTAIYTKGDKKHQDIEQSIKMKVWLKRLVA